MNRHVDFVRKHPSFNGKPWWLIINKHNGKIIADVFKHTKWDRFVCRCGKNTIWDAGCLQAVHKFVSDLNCKEDQIKNDND